MTAAGPPIVMAPGSSGLFQTMLTLRQNLQNSTDPAQLSNISASLDALTGDMNNMLAQQSIIGSISNRLTLTQGRIEDRKSILTQQYASIQDIDMPKVIADMNQQQSTFQASLGVTARIMQTSLLDFLR